MNKKLLAIACSWGALLLHHVWTHLWWSPICREYHLKALLTMMVLFMNIWKMVIIVWELLMIPYSIYWIVPLKRALFP